MYQCVHYIKYTSIYKVHVPMCPLSLTRLTHLFWVTGLERLFKNCRPACEWFVEFLASGENYIK